MTIESIQLNFRTLLIASKMFVSIFVGIWHNSLNLLLNVPAEMDREKLNNRQIKALKPTDKPYKMFDGDGMFLLVYPNSSKYWRLTYRFDGKNKLLALG